MPEFGAQETFTEGHARRGVVHEFKASNSQQSPFEERGRRVMRSGCNISVSDPSFWRSGHDQVTCSCKSLPNKCYSLSWQEWACPRAPLSPPRPGTAERRQSSAGCTLRARYSYPAHLSSLREPVAQPNWPSGFLGCPYGGGGWEELGAGRGQVPQKASQTDGCCHEVAEVGMGESPLPQGQWVALMRALETSRTQSPTCNLGPQLTHLPKAWWTGGPQGEGQDPPCTSLSSAWWSLTTDWLGPLAVAIWQLLTWGEKSIAKLTNGWAGSQMFAHW